MNPDSRHPGARAYLDGLSASGRFLLTSREMQKELGVSATAARSALARLAKRKLVASPVRGCYLIVPPEYRALGCLPAGHFVPELMARLGLRYYVGLLSAAQYHGAAHQRPQEFQVLLERNRRPIRCGHVRVSFVARKRMSLVTTQTFNTPYGTILVSTPEATAIDLVGYTRHSGGLGNVATVLCELASVLDPERLAEAAVTAPLPWAQRLGYLLDHVGAGDRTPALLAHVHEHARDATSLEPRRPRKGAVRDAKWKLDVNANVETQA